MDAVWLKSYPAGVPVHIDAGRYSSLADFFDETVSRFSSRDAYFNMGTALSYGRLDRLSRDFAACLQSSFGLKPGARVALMMPNVLQYPVALFGALRAGCIVVGCNPLYTPRELEHQLRDSGAEAVVILENFAHVLGAVVERTAVRHVVTTRLGDLLDFPKGPLVNFVVRHVRKMVPSWRIDNAVPFGEALRRGAAADFAAPAIGRDDVAFLQYTGGTTGVSKGAMLTHGNLLANVEQAHAWIAPHVEPGRETIVTALPLYHVFALTANCLTYFKIGATNVLITNPRDIAGFVRELAKHRFTAITGVNTLFNALLNHPGFAKLDFSALRISLGGGMAVQPSVAERWQRTTGCVLVEAYGLTEASPAVTINPLDIPAFTGAIGLPLPSTEVVIRDDDGRELPFGESGELCVRGPQVMKGYWNRPEATREVLGADGFLRTGDVAVIDEHGYVRLVDRKKDVILVSGFNVYPNEVEAVVALHEGVLEAAALGVPHPHSGEAVKLFVVRRDPALTAEEIVAHCREYLTAFKVPRDVEFRDELPKTNVGKVLRRALREKDGTGR